MLPKAVNLPISASEKPKVVPNLCLGPQDLYPVTSPCVTFLNSVCLGVKLLMYERMLLQKGELYTMHQPSLGRRVRVAKAEPHSSWREASHPLIQKLANLGLTNQTDQLRQGFCLFICLLSVYF